MPEIPNVNPNEVIASDWGNPIRDRTVQRYDDRSTRDSEHPSPTAGDLAYLENETVLEFFDGAAWVGFIPAGTVVATGRATAPAGWVLCQGQSLSRTTYATLFSAIGTAYGSVDVESFNVPDLRQRFPLGKAASGTGADLGDTGGSINHAHSHAHTHAVDPPSTGSSTNGEHDHGGLTSTAPGLVNRQAGSSGTMSDHSHSISDDGDHAHNVNIAQFNSGGASVTNTGSGNPPYVVLNYMIKA